MFSLCAEPPALEADDLVHLCASLNAPVLNIDVLPVGPARAAIVLHAERRADGSRRPQLSVGLRSLETGRVAVYQYQGDVRKLRSAARALDVALSFAEAMGFLFDDDLVGDSAGTGRVRAQSLWRKLVGYEELNEDSPGELGGVVTAGDLDPQMPDLSLGEAADAASMAPVATGADDVPGPVSAPALDRRTRDPAERTRSTDSGSDDGAESTPSANPGSSTLGRVPIVRMRVKAEGAAANEDNETRMLRLLGSF